MALYNLAIACYEDVLRKSVGYEAELANIYTNVNTDMLDDVSIDFTIEGFSHKIFVFAELFIDTLLDCAKEEF